MIEAGGLTKHYGNKVAVDNPDFRVRSGVVTGFLGPNGSGKSTTTRMIMTPDYPTRDQVTINEVPQGEVRSTAQLPGLSRN
jgi:ABC-2 type transport system ATP-binding protein